MTTHADALRQLFPLSLDGDYDAEVEIEGTHLDDALAASQALLYEAFPDTCDDTLEAWERVYGLVAGDATVEARRAALVARVRERGGLTIEYFVSLASALGFAVTVTEGDGGDPFRAGLSEAGDMVYDIEEQWTWTVNVAGSAGPEDALESLILDLAPAWTEVDFAYTP